jgi:hypothetical protein
MAAVAKNPLTAALDIWRDPLDRCGGAGLIWSAFRRWNEGWTSVKDWSRGWRRFPQNIFAPQQN